MGFTRRCQTEAVKPRRLTPGWQAAGLHQAALGKYHKEVYQTLQTERLHLLLGYTLHYQVWPKQQQHRHNQLILLHLLRQLPQPQQQF